MPGSPTICTNHGLPAPSRSRLRSSSASSAACPTRTRVRLSAATTRIAPSSPPHPRSGPPGSTLPSGAKRTPFRDPLAANTLYPGPAPPSILAGSGGHLARHDMEELMHDHDHTARAPRRTRRPWARAAAGLTAAGVLLVGGATAAFAAAPGDTQAG